jgi:hypothetical protein
MVWSHLKFVQMANFLPRRVKHLDRVVRGHLGEIGRAPGLIKSPWGGTKLPFLDKNLAA